ncbi:MAG: YbaB/EbfC family nucleoid-associated protein [Bacteroidota bacterium]
MDDFTKILSQMKEAQTKVQALQQKLAQVHATGEAGAGAVKATVNGHKQVLKLDIDKAFIRPEEHEVLQDLIIAAITLANQAVTAKVKEEIAQSTSGMGSTIPLDLIL